MATPMLETQTKIILAEPDEHLRELMLFSLESTFNFSVLEASDNASARSLFRKNQDIQLVICSNFIKDDTFYGLFKEIIDGSKGIPFIVTDLDDPETVPPYRGKKIAGATKKEQVITPLNKLIKNWFKKDLNEQTNEFTGIAFKTLQRFKGLTDDVYIRLISGRHLKLFAEGDEVTANDVLRFQEKGIERLYLKKEAAMWILISIDEQIQEFIKNPKYNFDLSQSTEDELIDFDINPLILEEEFIDAVQSQSQNPIQIIKKNRTSF